MRSDYDASVAVFNMMSLGRSTIKGVAGLVVEKFGF